MFGKKRYLAGPPPLLATVLAPGLATGLMCIAFVLWSGPLVPEAIRVLAPDNILLAELGQGSDALAARRRGGGGRS